MRIFFSHSSRDKALLRELRGYLPPWISSWIDEDELLIGSGLNASLEKAINEDVDYVVLFLGNEALNSPWVKREVQWALERESELGRVFLLPILLIDVRDRLDEFGLEGRITLEAADFSKDGVKMLADKLTNHLGGWLSEMLRVSNASSPSATATAPDDAAKTVANALTAVPPEWRSDVDAILTRPFLEQVTWSQIGRIPLTPTQYYQRILADMSLIDSGCDVLAVSMLASGLWVDNFDQAAYARRNLEAVRRGVDIKRLFIIPEGQQDSYRETIEQQLRSGVTVKAGTNRLVARVPQLEDFVMFKLSTQVRAYIAHPVIDGSRRIRSGFLELSTYATRRLAETFDEAWDLASPPADVFAAFAATRSSTSDEPGTLMRAHFLADPVISCEEAARARGIPLANELKTLILHTTVGPVAAHLPGDGILSLRKVKDRLESAEAYLADPEDLLAMDLSPGTVCAVLDPVWSMPHLVSRRVVDLSEVATNNGTRSGYFLFSPEVLTTARNVIVGDFEK